MNKVIVDLIDQVNKDGHQVLWICTSGSHLYNTNRENSDHDLRGCFLPSLESCILGKAPKVYSKSTGNDSSKNTDQDVDVQLFSIQYWLESLLCKSEINAIDLLFSFNNIIYEGDMLSKWEGYLPVYLFDNRDKLFSIKETRAFIGFAIGMAEKYQKRSERLNAIQKVLSFLKESLAQNPGRLMQDIWADLPLIAHTHKSYDEIAHQNMYEVSGRKFQELAKVQYVYDSLAQIEAQYGERVRKIMSEDEVDFKALSHALRAIRQLEELSKNGFYTFPLEFAEEIKSVKNRELSLDSVMAKIELGLQNVTKLQNETQFQYAYNSKWIDNLILSLYGV